MSLSKKIYLFIISVLIIFSVRASLLISTTRADGEFITDLVATYEVKVTGTTQVTNRIILTNTQSDYYAKSYSIVLNSITPTDISAYSDNGTPYHVNTTKENNVTTIEVEFPDQMVGKDKSRTFFLSFNENSFAVRTGEVWEISIPRISAEASFSSYYLNLKIPQDLGQEAYISPTPSDKSSDDNFLVYGFNKKDIEKTGITAGFGAFQVFAFNINYHLENPLSRNATTEITLPPDTAYQRIYYQNINPKPNDMYIDIDGNWIAKYNIDSRQRMDVTASGFVQIFSNHRPFGNPSPESISQSLKSSEYWNTSDPKILELARELKTPRAIYDYVSNHLSYNYDRVKPNVERLGASAALVNPGQAICMEFTDLFIALARAAGIPAREINGFAYTENPEIQPLSLVNDVLHAWPEYYDYDQKVWVPVDPTWGSTTGGVDYFTKLDLRHFTFVIHGNDSKLPYAAGSYKLGDNPQKDVYVSFGSLPADRNSKLDLVAKPQSFIPFTANRINVEINNLGPVALYNVVPTVYFDKVKRHLLPTLEIILPYQTIKRDIEIPFSFLGSKTPDTVSIHINDVEVTARTNKRQVIIYNLLFVFISAFLILLSVFLRLKKWKLPKIVS